MAEIDGFWFKNLIIDFEFFVDWIIEILSDNVS